MTSTDQHRDPVLAALRDLRTYDVSPALAQRLRTRYHHELASRHSSGDTESRVAAGVWMRLAGALAGAWSVVYLFETIRRAAMVFGF